MSVAEGRRRRRLFVVATLNAGSKFTFGSSAAKVAAHLTAISIEIELIDFLTIDFISSLLIIDYLAASQIRKRLKLDANYAISVARQRCHFPVTLITAPAIKTRDITDAPLPNVEKTILAYFVLHKVLFSVD